MMTNCDLLITSSRGAGEDVRKSDKSVFPRNVSVFVIHAHIPVYTHYTL
jgi:hypothetical protein